MDELKDKQQMLDKAYNFVKLMMGLVVVAAIIATFVQIYSINSKINSEVKQIQAAQVKNHLTNNQQNSVILGYLVCIGTIQPQDRTTAIINSCVAQAEKTNPVTK